MSLDEVRKYLAEKIEDDYAAQVMLGNMNHDELEYLFDMTQRHYNSESEE